ncbi:hypothetical protein ACO0LV_10765 [Pseudactinotalea sp. Z1739]|uniref:hypothetical protein n=1 Tax=Pseudactinotalea sp. Z1739 TaxID=3413028 RepID=UPI003C7E75A6
MRTAGLDVRWLSAPEAEVEAAITDAGAEAHDPPSWVPRRRSLVGYVSVWLLLWYLAVVWVSLGVHIDARGGWEPRDIPTVTVTMGIAIGWTWGTLRLFRWADRPSSSARIAVWRSNLTALANGFEPEPARRAHFSSLITGERRTARAYPRFVADGVEFGTLQAHGQHPLAWNYVRVALPAPQPHLILDATADGPAPRELPRPDPGQQILRGGTFDRSFRVFAPRAYETDAMFLLTPEVMAALADHAPRFNIELRDDSLVFFTRSLPGFTEPGSWRTVGALLRDAVPPLLARTERYRDQDRSRTGPGSEQEAHRRAAFDAAIKDLGSYWLQRAPSIGPVGKRLRMHKPGITWSRFRFGVRNVALFLLYVTPLSVAFGGFASAIFGR